MTTTGLPDGPVVINLQWVSAKGYFMCIIKVLYIM